MYILKVYSGDKNKELPQTLVLRQLQNFCVNRKQVTYADTQR